MELQAYKLFSNKNLTPGDAPLFSQLLQHARVHTLAPQEQSCADALSVSALTPIAAYTAVELFTVGAQGIHALLRCSFDTPVSFVAVRVEVYDASAPEHAACFVYYYENTKFQEISVTLSGKDAQAFAGGQLRCTATFVWSTDEQSMHEFTQDAAATPLGANDAVIKSFEVSAPRAHNHAETTVLYDREAFWTEKIDYHYTNLVSADHKTTKIKMPFAGKITVHEGYEISGVMKKPEAPSLYLIFENGSTVGYHHAKGFAEQFTLSADKKEISWNFDEDWAALQSLENISANTIVNISAHFTLNLRPIGSPLLYHPHMEVVSVETPQPATSQVVEVERIKIQWGCLAQGTKIQLADGSEKPIEFISIDDRLRLSSGEMANVENIINGFERELIFLSTTNGYSLRTTKNHPISTARGFVPAGELTAADIICTQNGNAPLSQLYVAQYEDTVYNLCIEPSGSLICNGIIAGDFTMQNTCMKNEPKPASTLLQQELRRLLQGIACTL